MIKTLLEIIYSFGKIGIISVGGGNSMLKLIEYEAVISRRWIAPEEFVNMLSSTFLFPGLTAVKLSALIGYKAAGIWGLILAVACINLPGLFLAFVGYRLLNHAKGLTAQKVMIAVQYGALVLLAAASYSVGEEVVKNYFSWPVAGAALFFCLGLIYLQLSPFWGFLAFIGVCFLCVRLV